MKKKILFTIIMICLCICLNTKVVKAVECPSCGGASARTSGTGYDSSGHYTKYTCSDCGTVNGPSTKHNMVSGTCTYKKCSGCSYSTGTSTHSYTYGTCTYKKCNNCSTSSGTSTHNWYVTGPIAGGDVSHATKCSNCDKTSTAPHSWSSATCEGNKYCNVAECAYELQGSSLGHTGGNATCYSKAVCTRCYSSYGGYASHEFGAYVVDTPATCTKTGIQSKHCKNFAYCNEGDKPREISALGHDWAYSTPSNHTCLRCNESEDHSFGSWTEGTTKHNRTCSKCEYTESDDHNWGSWSSTGPGTSNKHTRSCSTCNAIDSGYHSYGSWYKTSDTYHRRDCKTSGCPSYESDEHNWNTSTHTCTNCSYTHSVVLKYTTNGVDSHSYECQTCGGGSGTSGHFWDDHTDWCHCRFCGQRQSHTWDKSHKCTSCGHQGSHTSNGLWYGNGAGTQHYTKCSVCEGNYDYDDHWQSVAATCISSNYCNKCSEYWGAINSDAHDYSQPCPTCKKANIICSRDSSHVASHVCDSTPPTINSFTASSYVYTGGNITLTGTATDSQSGIVAYAIGSSSASYTTIANTSSTTQTTTVKNSGTYYFKVKDAAGYENSDSLTISKAEGSISYSTNPVNKTYGDGSFTNPLSNTGDGAVTYSSSDTSVAIVNSSTGAVTIKKVGSTTITATVSDGANYTYATTKASYTLNVARAKGSVSVSISGTTTVGQTLTANPSTASDGNKTYQWWRGNSSTTISGETSSTYTLKAEDAGKIIGVTVNVAQGTNYLACSNNAQTSETIKDKQAAVTTHPSNVSVKEGSTAKFTVVASGSNLTYQWQSRTSSSGSWSNVSGATSSSYTTPATTEGMNGYQYRCVITNNVGSVESNAATLTVYYPPKVATHPSNATVTYPNTATFTVVATAGNPSITTYQWQSRTSSSGSWSNISGATSSSYTTNATTVSMTGHQYRCVLSNEQYSGTVASNAATLTVNPATITIPTSPADKTYNGTSQAHGITIPSNTSIVTAESSTSATNAGTYKVVIKLDDSANYTWSNGTKTNKTVQWKINRKPVTIPTVTNKIYNATMQTALATGEGYTRSGEYEGKEIDVYQATATLDSNHIWNDGTDAPKKYTWSMLDVPVGNISGPTAVQLKENGTATFTVSADAGSHIQYQWYYNTANSTIGGTKISGATSNTYSVTVNRSMNNRYYYCVLSNNSNSATSLTDKASSTALLTVWWPHEIAAHPVDNLKVKSGETASFSVTAVGGNPTTYTYQWYSVNAATGGTTSIIPGATGSTYSFVPTQNIHQMWYYCVVSNGQYEVISNRAKLIADITLPTINIGAPSVAYANEETKFTLPITVTDTGEGFATATFTASDIVVKVNGIAITPTLKTLEYETASGNDYTYTLTLQGITGDGLLTIEVPAGSISDNFGNTNLLTSMLVIGITIDNVAPVISSNGEVLGTNNGYVNKEDTITIPLKITDLVGINPAEFTSRDIVAHVGSETPEDIVITVTYEGNVGEDYTYIVTVTGLTGDGELTLEIGEGKIKDLAGNVNTNTIITGLNVFVDNTKPEITDIVLSLGSYNNESRLYPESLPTYNESWINEDVYVVVNATDAGYGIAGVESYWHSENNKESYERMVAERETWSDEMENIIWYRVIDRAGNISDEVGVSIKIDKTNPVVADLNMRLDREKGLEYIYDADNPVPNSIYIKPKETTDAGDYQSGILKTEYIITFDNEVEVTISEPIDSRTETILKETGKYVIEVITTDKAGNKSNNFYNAAIEKITENTIKISNIHDEGSGVTKVTITARKQNATVDAIEPIVIMNPGSTINERIKLTDGTFIIKVEIVDGVGLIKELTKEIKNVL